MLSNKWKDLIKWELLIKQQWFKDILEFIDIQYKRKDVRICPDKENIFKMFGILEPHEINVVLMFQDPYATLRKGKCVSNGIGLAAPYLTPSLRNFYNSIELIGEPDISMMYLVRQEVFCINTYLTVEYKKPLSHSPQNCIFKEKPLRWDLFTKWYIERLSNKYRNIVYVLFGTEANNISDSIKYGHIIKTSHPSPRNRSNMLNNWWDMVNEKLKQELKYEIKWKKHIIQ